MTILRTWLIAGIAVIVLSACAASPDTSFVPTPALGFNFPIQCGPIQNLILCRKAVEVASTAKLNPPPIAAVTIRRPRADDACATAFRECGPAAVIVTIQSGDTQQEVPLLPTNGGWVRLDQVR